MNIKITHDPVKNKIQEKKCAMTLIQVFKTNKTKKNRK